MKIEDLKDLEAEFNRVADRRTSIDVDSVVEEEAARAGTNNVMNMTLKETAAESGIGGDLAALASNWLDAELRRLISVITVRGVDKGDGVISTTFGELKTAACEFETLSGVLDTAKNLGIVGYRGELREGGEDDAKVIRLLADKVPDGANSCEFGVGV